MANHKLKDLRGSSRRTFLKLMGAAGAGYGLSRSQLLNYIGDQGGSALADEGACGANNRSVHLSCGGGSFAWMQLLWPLVRTALDFKPTFSYHELDDPAFYDGVNYRKGFCFDHLASGTTTSVGSGSKGKFYYGPESPFRDDSGPTPKPLRAMTAFMSGITKTHDRSPLLQSMVIDGSHTAGTSVLAAITAMQKSTVALLPVIGVSPMLLGAAPGVPSLATVPTADAMVELFNSAASRAVLLAEEDKATYETFYKAVLGLRDAAGRPTWAVELSTLKSASHLIGQNLASLLVPQPEDLEAYGVNDLMSSGLPNGFLDRLGNLAKALITTKKAMENGLTNSVVIGLPPGTGGADGFTDPHNAITGKRSDLQMTAEFMGRFLDAFYEDLATAPDPACTTKMLDQTVVFTAHGDQPHTPFNRSAWPDNTPGSTNWVYVMGNGYLKPGWFGDGKPDDSLDSIHPTTGMIDNTRTNLDTAHSASAAIAYAVAKGDMNRVKEFYKGPDIDAFVV